MRLTSHGHWLSVLLAAFILAVSSGAPAMADPAPSATLASPAGSGLSNTLGSANDAAIWREVGDGVRGYVSIPDEQAAQLIQRNGEQWRLWKLGPIAVVGMIAFWTMFAVVVGYYILRGKVRIQSGRSGRQILRFAFIERFAHWLTAFSFLILAATGVNLLYGRYVLPPLIGHETFASITQIGKYVHNYVGFAFIVGLFLIFWLWVRDNLWDRYDWNWIKQGGGLIFPSKHPPAAKFNFGQKTVFWMVIVGGLILTVTGINLLLPFRFASLEQMQWMAAIHATLSQVMCLLMVAHIYVGTVGMQDAFHAMSTGYVDVNWAKEHHKAWYDEVASGVGGVDEKAAARRPGIRGAPAE
jgi:formate dehydrogenase subunit gamma